MKEPDSIRGVDEPTMAQSAREARGLKPAALVVNDQLGIADDLRRRYPGWQVSVTETYVSAISELARHTVRAVVAFVDPSHDELEKAVAGLREAAGSSTKLLLCCRAEAEPLALRAMKAGADDYLLYPLRGDELDAALAEPGHDVSETIEPSAITGRSMAELKALGDVVSRLGSPPNELLGPLAELLRTAMGAVGARVVVEGTVGVAGADTSEPEMVEALYRESRSIGHVAIGAKGTRDESRGSGEHAASKHLAGEHAAGEHTASDYTSGEHTAGDYIPPDVDKLRQYATLIGHIVSAALDRHRLHQLAYTDELSGLPNRRYLLESLGQMLRRAREDHSCVTLLMFDIDDFKSYNDAYGHDAGDEIIRGCGELFRRNVRDHDLVTRYGGDEFAVIFWDKGKPRVAGSHHPTDLLPLIKRFRRSLREHRFERFNLPASARLTISGGLATFPVDASSVETLITRADEALLVAKRGGKNCIYLGGENGGRALGAETEV